MRKRWGKSNNFIFLPLFGDPSFISSFRYSKRPSKISKRFLTDSLSPLTTFSPENKLILIKVLFLQHLPCSTNWMTFMMISTSFKLMLHRCETVIHICASLTCTFKILNLYYQLLVFTNYFFSLTCNMWEADLKVIQGQRINHTLDIVDIFLLTTWHCNII